MFKKIALAAACALAMSGCNTTSVVNGINAVSGALTNPQSQQALANLKAGSTAIICGVSSVAQLASKLTIPGHNGQVMIADAQTLYTDTAATCAFLGGTPGALGTVPATAVPPATSGS